MSPPGSRLSLPKRLPVQQGLPVSSTRLSVWPKVKGNYVIGTTNVEGGQSYSWVILVNMEISVILGHEKTKIRNIIDYGKIDVFSVRTNIYIKNKMMGHLIWPFGVLLYKTFQKWDVPRWRKAGWMIVVTCQTHFFLQHEYYFSSIKVSNEKNCV